MILQHMNNSEFVFLVLEKGVTTKEWRKLARMKVESSFGC
jgi:hypothetical protein